MEFIHQLGGLSYLGVFGISLIATVILPFPEEITLLSLGYLAGVGVFHLGLLIPICMLGLFLSDYCIYLLAYNGSKIVTGFYNRMFASKFDFLNHLSGNRLDRFIIFSRFLIYFRFLSPFLAGYYRYTFKKFIRNETISLSVYVSLFLFLGFFLRNRLERVLAGVGVVQNIIGSVIIILAAVFVFKALRTYMLKTDKWIDPK